MLLATHRRSRHDRHSLPRFDGRTLIGRRYTQLLRDFAAEIGGEISAVDRALLEQAVALMVRAEILNTRDIAGPRALDLSWPPLGA
jgi:hypothetical protein